MAKRQLRGKQLAVLDDLFNSDLDEQGVLDKHGVKRGVYERWLANGVFKERFSRYVDNLRRRSELLMARYRCLAAAKLVELTASDKAETARKACLDIIRQENGGREAIDEGRQAGTETNQQKIAFSSKTASKLLAVMAEGKSGGE